MRAEQAQSGAHEQAPAVTGEIRHALREAALRSLGAIEAALSAGNTNALVIELHSMRGGFALAGDSVARDACAQMEATVKSGGAAAFESHWDAFRSAIEHAMERIGQWWRGGRRVSGRYVDMLPVSARREVTRSQFGRRRIH